MSKTPRDLAKAEFASKLQRLLNEKGWTQSDLARQAEKYLPKGDTFQRSAVSSWLSKAALPRQHMLVAISKALGVEPRDLLPNVKSESLPYSMRPAGDDPQMAWLQVDMKVPMATALSVLTMLQQARGR